MKNSCFKVEALCLSHKIFTLALKKFLLLAKRKKYLLLSEAGIYTDHLKNEGQIMASKLNVILPFATILLLTGCGSMVGAHSNCSQTNTSYIDMWGCIKGRIASGTAGLTNNSQTVRYVAAGDALAEQVKSGKISDIQAKALIAEELERAETSFNRSQSLSRTTVCNYIGNTLICN